MIQRFRFGSPVSTDAVVLPVDIQPELPPRLRTEKLQKGVRWTLALGRDDLLMGLGENTGPINRRGRRYQSWNSDEFNHSEDRQSLYASHNLLLILGEEPFAIYLDDPGRVIWDLGFTDRDQMSVESENGDLDLYLITPEDASHPAVDLCRQFRSLTGRSYIPPRWALGYIQSRWGYASEEDMRTVADAHKERHIPLDGICLDIDYMDGFRDFTVDREAIPDLARLCGEMKQEGLHLIPIIDAGVKADPAYSIWAEGHAKGYFCKKEDGSEFTAAVWPGLSAFPDFMREDVREWFGACYRPLLEAGINGFWNDMNEPALFYSPEGLAEAVRAVSDLSGKMEAHDASFHLIDAVNRIKNSMDEREQCSP